MIEAALEKNRRARDLLAGSFAEPVRAPQNAPAQELPELQPLDLPQSAKSSWETPAERQVYRLFTPADTSGGFAEHSPATQLLQQAQPAPQEDAVAALERELSFRQRSRPQNMAKEG